MKARVDQLEEGIRAGRKKIDDIYEKARGDIESGMAFNYEMPWGLQQDVDATKKIVQRMEAELNIAKADYEYATEAEAVRKQYADNLKPFADQVGTPGTVYKEGGMNSYLIEDMKGGPSHGAPRFEMRDVVGHSVVILQPNYQGTMLQKTYGPIDVNGYVLLMPQVMDQRDPEDDDTSEANYGIKEFGHTLSREEMNLVAQAVAETARRIADPKQMGGVKLGPKAVFDILSTVADQVVTELRK